MREENSSLETQLAERNLKRKQKEVEDAGISKNKQLEGNHNATTCEPTCGVCVGKFPSRSTRRKYAKRRLKREIKAQAASMQQNEGDATKNETCHLVSNSALPDKKAPEMNLQKGLPNDIYQLESSTLSVPEKEATEMAGTETVPSTYEILTIALPEISKRRSNQLMREGNSSLETQLAETERDSKRKQKEIENSRCSKTKKIGIHTNTKKLYIGEESSYKSTQQEPNMGSSLRRSSYQVIHERVKLSTVTKGSPLTTVATENANNQTSQGGRERSVSINQICRNEQLEENCDATAHKPNSGVPLKKFPSRSARRKYAQRQLKKEMKKQVRELQDTQTSGEDTTKNGTQHRVFSRHESLPNTYLDFVQPRTDVDAVGQERSHQAGNFARVECKSHHPASSLPSRSARRKYTKRKLKKELRKQATENMQNEVSPNGTGRQATENLVVPAQEPAGTRNLVVARVDRPGDIRFVSEGENNDDDDVLTNMQPNEPPMECFQWKGIMIKTKGQKWGQDVKSRYNASRYGTTSNKRNTAIEDSLANEKCTEKNTSNIEKATLSQVNFESLTPLTRSPKEGELIAYRVVELSSTWCPDLSPFRVGEVKSYDLTSNRIVLVPIPEHPIFSEREGDDAKDGEEDASYKDELSLYKDDGSLEIDFASLVDVWLLRVNSSVSPSESSVSRKPNSRKAAMEKNKSLYNRTKMAESRSSADVVKPISKWVGKDVDLMHDTTDTELSQTVLGRLMLKMLETPKVVRMVGTWQQKSQALKDTNMLREISLQIIFGILLFRMILKSRYTIHQELGQTLAGRTMVRWQMLETLKINRMVGRSGPQIHQLLRGHIEH